MEIIEQSHEEKVEMYMKLSKEELVDILISCNNNLDIAIKIYNLIHTIGECSDNVKLKRLAKMSDMVRFIWELVHNGWREFDDTDYDYKKSWDKIQELLDKYRIDIDDLNDD